MKKIVIIFALILVATACIRLCYAFNSGEAVAAPSADRDYLVQETTLPVAEEAMFKYPDKSVLYNQLVDPNRELAEIERSRLNELPPPSFYPVEDALSAKDLGLLTPTIYSRKITLPLDKGGELVLGRDQEEGSSVVYLNPRVVNEGDPEGTQYGFYLLDYIYASFNRPNPELLTSKIYMIDDFHSLEIYDLNGEALAQYDRRAAEFAILTGVEYERIPSIHYFINRWTYEFIPCDGGVCFGPCYFHYEDDKPFSTDILSSDYAEAFMAWMKVVRLSDGEILDIVGISLEETEFNVFELKALSLGVDFK